MILSPAYHCLASVPEALFWLLVGVVWVVIQIVQRIKRSNLPPAPPVAPEGRVRGEVRDLDDFLEEMFERTRAPEPDKGSEQHQAVGNMFERAQPPEALRPNKAHRPHAHVLQPTPVRKPTPFLGGRTPKTPRPTASKRYVPPKLKVLKGQAPTMLARSGRQTVAQTKIPMRSGLSMPSLPALRQNSSTGGSAHHLTSDLRKPVGRRQAVLWREVLGPPRSLQPM